MDGAVSSETHVQLGVHHRGLRRGPSKTDHDHTDVEHQSRSPHGRCMIFFQLSALPRRKRWPHVVSVLCWQSVEERCQYRINPENSSWTEITREACIASGVCGLSRPIQVSKNGKETQMVQSVCRSFCDVFFFFNMLRRSRYLSNTNIRVLPLCCQTQVVTQWGSDFFILCFQEFGLARFKTSVAKTMKGFEYVLAKMQGELWRTSFSFCYFMAAVINPHL